MRYIRKLKVLNRIRREQIGQDNGIQNEIERNKVCRK